MSLAKGLRGRRVHRTLTDKWLALRVSLVLTVLLTGLLGFVAISVIEIIIAVLSVAASGIARLFILFHTGNGQERAASELIMGLEAMGTAGVGTLVVLYLLA
ncbi:hypothetical protein R5M92_15195 [Halomonas sp. Bachu 37]|uniref:hypothetical protein n=1 Tax=Halomonas kashgarensis TaxID=3084920 RepID=UPI0032172B36